MQKIKNISEYIDNLTIQNISSVLYFGLYRNHIGYVADGQIRPPILRALAPIGRQHDNIYDNFKTNLKK